MGKKYKFTLDNYYDADELNNVAPIIENFVNLFADDNGVATLDIRNDVHVVVRRDEGAVLHMVIDTDKFTALPKSLEKAKRFADTFIKAMAKAVDDKKKASDVNKIKNQLESKAETDLLDYIGGTDKISAPATTDNTTVKVNGTEVTDPAEKQKVMADIDKKIADTQAQMSAIKEKMTKAFTDTFANFFDTYLKF